MYLFALNAFISSLDLRVWLRVFFQGETDAEVDEIIGVLCCFLFPFFSHTRYLLDRLACMFLCFSPRYTKMMDNGAFPDRRRLSVLFSFSFFPYPHKFLVSFASIIWKLFPWDGLWRNAEREAHERPWRAVVMRREKIRNHDNWKDAVTLRQRLRN